MPPRRRADRLHAWTNAASPGSGCRRTGARRFACRILPRRRGQRCVEQVVIVTQQCRRAPHPPRRQAAGLLIQARLAHLRRCRCGSPFFITCFNDTLFPGTGAAWSRCWSASGHGVDFPEEQTCCGQMHGNTGYAATRPAAGAAFARVFGGAETVVSPSASCARTVRERDARWADSTRPPVHELTELLVDSSARGRRRRLPAPGHLPPDVPLAAPAAGRRPAAAPAARGARPRAGGAARGATSAAASAGRSRSRTPTRRSRCSRTSSRTCRTRAPRCASRPTTRA